MATSSIGTVHVAATGNADKGEGGTGGMAEGRIGDSGTGDAREGGI